MFTSRVPFISHCRGKSMKGGGGAAAAAVPTEAWHGGCFNVPSTPPKTLWFCEPLTRVVSREKWINGLLCLSGREGSVGETREKKRRQSALINFPQGCTPSHLNKTNDLICCEELETWANKPWHGGSVLRFIKSSGEQKMWIYTNTCMHKN